MALYIGAFGGRRNGGWRAGGQSRLTVDPQRASKVCGRLPS
jgi:hypothetical protein